MRRTAPLALIVVIVAALAAPTARAAVPIQTIATYDASRGEWPEGLALDHGDNIYVGLAGTGEIRRIAPDGSQTTLARLPVGQGLLLGIATRSRDDAVYALVASFDPATHGVWRVGFDGPAERIAALDPNGFPNGIAFDRRGNLYASDSFLGLVWRLKPGGTPQVWVRSPLLDPDPAGLGIGANGLAFDAHGDLYVANSDRSSVVKIPVQSDGSAGRPRVLVQDARLHVADGMAFDTDGNLYVACSLGNDALYRVHTDRSIETLATAADGLDYPANIAFGTDDRDRKSLYIANVGADFGHASVARAQIGVPGLPLP
jgi:sugar lactone lactonase YvrE